MNIYICYSNAKSTLIVPLTFIKLEKTEPEKLILIIFFVCLFLSSSSSLTWKLYGVSKYYAYQTIGSASGDHSYLFWALCELPMASYMYGQKTVSKKLCVLARMLLGFLHNNCVSVARIVRPHLD